MSSERKKIVAKPFGGLANRLRVISSLIWLKRRFNSDLKIIWLANEELNANYSELFQDHPDFEVMQVLGKYRFIKTSNQKNKFKRKLARIINNLMGVDYCVFDSDVHQGTDHIINIVESNNTIFFNTCEEIIQFDKGLRSIQLNSRLLSIINDITFRLSFDHNVFGIHIRRTDHNIAIKSSPLSIFEEVLECEFNLNPETRAYIASDDFEVLQYLQKKYKDRVFFISKVFGRNSKEGIMYGVIELFLLSKTIKIYGSYWSSYSIIAGRLSGIKVEMLRAQYE